MDDNDNDDDKQIEMHWTRAIQGQIHDVCHMLHLVEYNSLLL